MSIDKSTIVITTKEIINKTKKVALVFHDEEDGIWEFLDGEDVKIRLQLFLYQKWERLILR